MEGLIVMAGDIFCAPYMVYTSKIQLLKLDLTAQTHSTGHWCDKIFLLSLFQG
jgi:hypothetical protein